MYFSNHGIALRSYSRRHGWRLVGLLLLLSTLSIGAAPAPVHAQSCVLFPSDRDRFGVNVARDNNKRITDYDVTAINANWYLDYTTTSLPSHPNGMAFAQMVRTSLWQANHFTTTVESTLAANPGTLWIIGNEPDRDKQDGITPAVYARFYHDVYHFIKTRDVSARVAVAGVVESTPLRRRYLDMVLSAYQSTYSTTMPVDVWTVHGFILPENYQWGASIPPGLEAFASEGMQYTVSDHDSVAIFQQNLIDFRQWMADRGYRERPLLITEYGILLSPLHGFPYSRVSAFMLSSFDFFRTATSATTGYSSDGNRLVQGWSWFSLNYPPYDETNQQGQNGNLYEPHTAELLPLGTDYGNYVNALPTTNQVQLALNNLAITPSRLVLTPLQSNSTIPLPEGLQHTSAAISTQAVVTPTLTLTGTLLNSGDAAGCQLTLQLLQRTPTGRTIPLQQQTLATLAAAGQHEFSFTWELAELTPGAHTFTIRAQADNAGIGLPIDVEQQQIHFNIYLAPLTNTVHLPLINR